MKHQGNVFASLMSNFDIAREALDTSLNSSGSAMAEHAKWSESLEARLNKLKATWQSLSQSFMSSDFLKVVLSGITGLINGVNTLIDTFGTLPTLVGAFAAFESFKGIGLFKTIRDEATGTAISVRTAFTDIRRQAGKIFMDMGAGTNVDFRNSLQSDVQALTNYKIAVQGGMSQTDALRMHMNNASESAKAYAKSSNVAALDITKFSNQQKASQVTLSASNKSLASAGAIMAEYNNGCKNTAMTQADFISAVSNGNPALGSYLTKLNGAKAGISGYITSLIGAKVATIALQAATIAMNMALTMGISALITWGISKLDEWIETADELAEKVDEVTSKFKEQQKTLSGLKKNYNTSDEDSLISKYAELSKGVDEYGQNLSLTADEYAEYQNIVGTIAEEIPSLVAGYDSQGNAILSCKDNVTALTAEYEKLIKAQNESVLKGDNAKDIEKDFKNAMKSADKYDAYDDKITKSAANSLDEMLNGKYSKTKITELLNQTTGARTEIAKALENAGLESGLNWWDSTKDYDEFIKDAIDNHPDIARKVITDFYNSLESEAEGVKSQAAATLSDAFDISDSQYFGMSEGMKNLAYQVVNGFDAIKYDEILKGQTVEEYVNGMLDSFMALEESGHAAKIESAFNLKTQLNGGDISYGEYIDGIKSAGELIDGLDLDSDIKSSIKLALNTDEIVEEYDALINRLTSEEIGLDKKSAKNFLDSLSAEEFTIATQIIPKLDGNATVDEIQAMIDKEMALKGLNIDLNLEVVKAELEALSTALNESVSGIGLSSESISAIEGMFSDLAGYDSSKLFERTANGIKLNNTELKKLNDLSKKTNIAKVNKEMDSLSDIYNQTRNELYDLTYGTDEYNSKLLELDGIEQQIKDLEKLSASYDGVMSAYQEWQMMESAGSQRTMYEGIIEGWENVKDEISRGWIDDGTREFLELLYGEKTTITKIVDGEKVKKEIDIATASASDLKKAFKELDEIIPNTAEGGHKGYKISDFFTVDDEGNSTSKGVYNFLDAIGHMEEEMFGGKNVVDRKDGNIIGFDFQMVGGDKVIADALGVSEELVQIMKRAAADAGFVVTFDGSFEQLDILREKAQKASEELNKILDKKGAKGYSFNFNSTDEKDITTQLAKAKDILSVFKKDGVIDLSMEGAEEALNVARTLQSMLDNIQRPAYMKIETSQVEKDLREPLRNLQEFRTLTEQEHQIKLSGGDTTELEKSKQEVYDYFEKLDTDVKVKLGLIDDKGNPLTGQTLKDKLNSGDVTVEASIDLQLEMDEKLGILVDKALLDAGIINEEEFKKRVNVYLEADIDNKDAKDKTENATEEIVGDKKETKSVEVIAEVFGVEDVDSLADKLKDENLDDKTIEAVAKVVGQTDIDTLKETINSFSSIDKLAFEVIAKAIGEGDVESLARGIDYLDDKTVEAVAKALGYDDVESLKQSILTMDGNTVKAIAQALGITDVESLKQAINNMQGNTVDAEVNTDGQSDKVTTLQTCIDGLQGNIVVAGVNTDGQADKVTVLQDSINKLKGRIVTVGVRLANAGKNKANQRTGADPSGDGVGEVNGTANINGTAFAQGNWRTNKTETALTGELGREIVVTPQNRWYTVGDNGAEFVNIPRGSIVFNHKQTEELLRNGKATSDGGRARALVNGTAFLGGTAHIGVGEYIAPEVGSISVGSYKKSKDGKDKDFEETIDFIEIALSRIQREIDRLDKQTNNVYKSWSSRNAALASQISMIGEEINLQNKAYNGYIAAANKVGLSEDLATKIRNGAIDIDTITDETLKQKIDDYKNYYEAALACKDAILELKETESSLYAQRIENIATQYEGILGVVEHEKNMLDEYISQSEAQGWLVSTEYYDALKENENDNITKLKEQKNEMLAELETAMESETITKYSQGWYELVNSIDEVTLSITEGETALLEYAQAIQEIKFEQFDLLQDRISAVTEEADFLIELLSNDKLHDDNGKLTNEGLSTMGLHGQNYNAYMYQADLVAKEIKRLEKDMKTDKYDKDLEERYREMISLQQEFILSAEDEKNAIRDLVEDGIELELDALQERIDKYNEALESQKDLYDYQKKIKEQTKEIASLEKQMAAYAGDDSEEARQKIQQIKVDLESAKADLEETEYDKYISDQEKLLDDLYLEYEEILNTRLDNIDALVSDMISEINANASIIDSTISESANSVGYTLSDSMEKTWDVNSTKINDVITIYGDKFSDAQARTINVLNAINASTSNMVNQLNKKADDKIKTAKDSSAADSKQANVVKKEEPEIEPVKKEEPVAKTIKIGGKIDATGAQIYDYAGDTSGERQLYRNDPIYTVIAEKNGYLKVRYHKLSSGVTGWFKKNDVKAYATGKQNFLNNEIAWTQENGQEFIVRPSDGAILTPIAKGDSVLTSVASRNIWDMANSPVEFIKDNLSLGTTNVPNNSTVQSVSQNFENITFNLPNVQNYEQLLSSLQKDPKFDKLVKAMTIDQIAGKSSLAKGKVIK